MKTAIITTVIFFTGLALFSGVVFYNVSGIRRNTVSLENPYLAVTITPSVSPTATPDIPTATPVPSPSPSPTVTPQVITNIIDYKVPFTAQAPLAQWNDPVFQDGCEEASILMAVYWAQGKSIGGPQEATRLIQAISDYEQKTYGEFRDRSIVDTADLLRTYFNYNNVQLKRNITLQDIKDALSTNSVVVVPAAGRELPNPNFSPPGPLNHMLVIRGYDPTTKQFITNEPGTRNGEAFRYREDDLYGAIRDYPTGYHEPITSIEKNMLIVSKNSI